jgi:hypothetical protein
MWEFLQLANGRLDQFSSSTIVDLAQIGRVFYVVTVTLPTLLVPVTLPESPTAPAPMHFPVLVHSSQLFTGYETEGKKKAWCLITRILKAE